MKQHITAEQVQELSPEQQEKLREWWQPDRGDHIYLNIKNEHMMGVIPNCNGMISDIKKAGHKEHHLPLLSIGQMIELIFDKTGDISVDSHKNGCSVVSSEGIPAGCCGVKTFTNHEIIDALWEAVKEVL